MRTDVAWDSVAESQDAPEKLQPGGYVACVVGLRDVPYNVNVPNDDPAYNSSGDYLEVSFDIAEGEYAGYYQRKNTRFPGPWQGRFRIYYNSPQYGENYGRLKAFKTALEESNGIKISQFDQRTLDALAQQRKLFGALMGYDQKRHKYLNVMLIRDANVIRSGDYKIPDEWKIHIESASANAWRGSGHAADTGTVYADDEGDLPF